MRLSSRWRGLPASPPDQIFPLLCPQLKKIFIDKNYYLKGTILRDFLPRAFTSKSFSWSQRIPRVISIFCRHFAEIFRIKNNYSVFRIRIISMRIRRRSRDSPGVVYSGFEFETSRRKKNLNRSRVVGTYLLPTYLVRYLHIIGPEV